MTPTPYIIRPIRPAEAAEAARINTAVAYEMMQLGIPLEEFAAGWAERKVLADLDDVRANYDQNGGVFLVLARGTRMIGTGGFQRYAEGVCVLRRVALLPEERGQGFGYALMRDLLRRARAMGYHKMVLWTDRWKTQRAVALYRRMGFVEVTREGAYENELWMEMPIPAED